MSITWINAAAFAGLALVALPIAIHLLVRQQTRVLAFPSLRFLRETALAAFRRRRIEDAVLLLCRAAIVIAAVAALAGPILQTPARTAGYASRTSRAIVVAGATGATGATGASRKASSVIRSPDGTVTMTDAEASISAFAKASSAFEAIAMSSRTTVLSASK